MHTHTHTNQAPNQIVWHQCASKMNRQLKETMVSIKISVFLNWTTNDKHTHTFYKHNHCKWSIHRYIAIYHLKKKQHELVSLCYSHCLARILQKKKKHIGTCKIKWLKQKLNKMSCLHLTRTVIINRVNGVRPAW